MDLQQNVKGKTDYPFLDKQYKSYLLWAFFGKQYESYLISPFFSSFPNIIVSCNNTNQADNQSHPQKLKPT